MTKEPKNGVGRPEKVDDYILQKLEDAFARGCTNREACLFADLPERTFYDYKQENPEFSHRIDELREAPMLKARFNITQAIAEGDIQVSQWYAERKKKSEFSTKIENETTAINLNMEQSQELTGEALKLELEKRGLPTEFLEK
jgi:hypothetical protein